MSHAVDLAEAQPSFLRRTPAKENTAMAPTPTKAPKTKRRDSYVCRATISIPLDMSDAETLAKATKAVDAITAGLPAGSKVEFQARSLGKMSA